LKRTRGGSHRCDARVQERHLKLRKDTRQERAPVFRGSWNCRAAAGQARQHAARLAASITRRAAIMHIQGPVGLLIGLVWVKEGVVVDVGAALPHGTVGNNHGLRRRRGAATGVIPRGSRTSRHIVCAGRVVAERGSRDGSRRQGPRSSGCRRNFYNRSGDRC
jgi:hypothetical protein